MGVLGVGLGACCLVSVAGSLWCWLAGNGWRRMTFAQTGPTLGGLVRDPGQPAAAYPERVAAGLPGPLLFWTVVVLLLAALLVLTAAAVGWWARCCRVAAPEGAAWAGARDERRIAVPDDPQRRRWRLVAGRATRTRRLVAAGDCISAVVFGPNGSGKPTRPARSPRHRG
jgi:hypothetical protein